MHASIAVATIAGILALWGGVAEVVPSASPIETAAAYCVSGLPAPLTNGCYTVTQCGPSLNGGRPPCIQL